MIVLALGACRAEPDPPPPDDLSEVLTFPASDIYTRVDVGLSEDGPGYYLYVGEAF